MRDIDTTVTFMRDLLKHEASTRSSNTSSPTLGGASLGGGGGHGRDATAYKHDDTHSGTYKPSSRHLDRSAVRYAGEDSDADIKDIRRQLQSSSALLDSSNDDRSRKTEEDQHLEQEVDDLKYRVKRLQQDIDYVSKGRRSTEKDEERRKLERELLFLMHEKLPELERRQEQREEEKRREERVGVRARDKRNQTLGRYDDRDDDRGRGGDSDWLRGTYDRDRRDRDRGGHDSRDRSRERRYDRDRGYDRDREYRDRSRDRSRDREYRSRTPPGARSPPPAPPPAAVASASPAPPPAPTAKPASGPDTKKMTPEERTAFIRAQAQARIQDRLRALGVESAPADTPVVDRSVEERLEAERVEAENKSKAADEEQKKREEARQARLAGAASPQPPAKAAESAPTPAAPAPPTPKSILKGKTGPPPPPASRAKQAPPPPVSRGPAKASPAPVPAQPEEDPEEAGLRRREEAMAKAKEDRRKRLEQIEKDEADEARREAEASLRNTKSPATITPAADTPSVASPATGGGYNPFRKPGGGGSATPGAATAPAAGGGGFNPFFKPPAAAQTPAVAPEPIPTSDTPATAAGPPPTPPPPPPPPAESSGPPPPTSRSAAADDEWEKIEEKGEDSDSSSDDDDYATSRDHRRNLASALFGNAPGGSPTTNSRPGSAAPAPHAAAVLQNLGGGDPEVGRGALLSAIQGGRSLRKAQTVVKGETGGRVIGDAAPPAHINLTPQPRESTGSEDPAPVADQSLGMGNSMPGGLSASPEPTAVPMDGEPSGFDSDFTPRNNNRGSVDWYAGLAADQHPAGPGAGFGDTSVLEPTKEEDEEDEPAANGTGKPEIKVEGADDLSEFDMTRSEWNLDIHSMVWTFLTTLRYSRPDAVWLQRSTRGRSQLQGRRGHCRSSRKR